jgi:hypothetical protein
MGLILRFRLNPSPRCFNYAYLGLPAGMNVHVFYRDLLRALAAMAIERVEQHREGARELASLVQVFMPQAGRVAVQGDRVAVHRGIVAGEHLRRNHVFQRILRGDSGYTSGDRAARPNVNGAHQTDASLSKFFLGKNNLGPNLHLGAQTPEAGKKTLFFANVAMSTTSWHTMTPRNGVGNIACPFVREAAKEGRKRRWGSEFGKFRTQRLPPGHRT